MLMSNKKQLYALVDIEDGIVSIFPFLNKSYIYIYINGVVSKYTCRKIMSLNTRAEISFLNTGGAKSFQLRGYLVTPKKI
jgi:hypothetical protein